jgi:TetR/AcrR family transcriptional regulator of autoinduction and epiphytic fitness
VSSTTDTAAIQEPDGAAGAPVVPPEPVDGRTARAVRTREAIVDATIALLAEGDLKPSAPRIAERAGVSVRSIFQHFDDLETLHAAVGARVVDRVAPLLQPIDPALPLEERLPAFIRQRARVNEALTPTLRAAVVHAPGSRSINSQFQTGHEHVGARVGQVFEPELAMAPDRQLLLDSLVAVASWSLWNTLRSLNRRSEAESERILLHLAACTLGPVVGRDLTALVDAAENGRR